MLSPATRARVLSRAANPGLADSPLAICCRPLRGLASFHAQLTQGSRTRPGLYAVARYAGSRCFTRQLGSRTRPEAICCRPLRGLASFHAQLTQGSRTRPGLHAVARSAGSNLRELGYRRDT